MATQGIVSIVQAGKVLFKVVVGCDGSETHRLAARLRTASPSRFSLDFLYAAAADCRLGCRDCRVVISKDGLRYDGEALPEEALRRYRETFRDPRFNPRWERGTAGFVEVVEMETEKRVT